MKHEVVTTAPVQETYNSQSRGDQASNNVKVSRRNFMKIFSAGASSIFALGLGANYNEEKKKEAARVAREKIVTRLENMHQDLEEIQRKINEGTKTGEIASSTITDKLGLVTQKISALNGIINYLTNHFSDTNEPFTRADELENAAVQLQVLDKGDYLALCNVQSNEAERRKIEGLLPKIWDILGIIQHLHNNNRMIKDKEEKQKALSHSLS